MEERILEAKLDNMQQVIELVNVQQALNTYHQAASHMDLEAILRTYAEDGTWELKLGEAPISFTGSADLRQGYQTMFIDEGNKFSPPQGPEVQLNAPATISFHDGKAYAHSVILIMLRPHGGKSEAVTGFYDDVLRKVGEEWKFEKRSFTLNFFWRAPEVPS